MKKLTILVLMTNLVLSLISCKKLPEGNLSHLIRYETATFRINQERLFTSDALNMEGSAKPITVKLLNVYNRETGEDVTKIFTKEYPFKSWKALYNPLVDTTVELITAKQKQIMLAPISINSVSGQIEANLLSKNLPVGKYKFDLEVENPIGKRVFNGIGEFDLVGAPPYEIPTVRQTTAIMVGNETRTRSISSNESHLKVQYLNTQEGKIVLRFLDKNGVVFNPGTEIQKRPLPGNTDGFYQTMQDYSLSTTIFDDRIEFVYGVLPFPLESLGNGFNCYYRIPAEYVEFDNSLNLPYNTYSCNVRFSLQAFAHGTYMVDVIIPRVVRVP